MRLKELREAKGFTVAKLGELASIPASTIWYYEHQQMWPNKERTQRLTAALGCTVVELMGDDLAEWQDALRNAETIRASKPYLETSHELRRLRKAAGLTIYQAAAMLGVAESTISSYEGGRKPMSKRRFTEIKTIYSNSDTSLDEEHFDFSKEDETYHRQLALANGSWRPQ